MLGEQNTERHRRPEQISVCAQRGTFLTADRREKQNDVAVMTRPGKNKQKSSLPGAENGADYGRNKDQTDLGLDSKKKSALWNCV